MIRNQQSSGPLSGVKVIDFSTLLPGPYASMLLADMGADVLRVESPNRSDLTKSIPPIINGQSAVDLQLNRNKTSIALNLKSENGKAIALQLISDADVLLEQFRPGVMQRLGLAYETLKADNPALVYCSLTGYGQTGPWAQRAGHDINYLSVSGLSSYSGRKGEPPPPFATQFADIAGGSHHAVMGVLAALLAARQSGRGCHVDISMTDAMFALNAMSAASALVTGEDPAPESGWLNGGSFYDYYKCADGAYLAVGGLEPAFIDVLSRVLQCDDLQQLKHLHDQEIQRQLKSRLQEIFVKHVREYWLEVFADEDACVTPVLTINEAAQNKQLMARQMLADCVMDSGDRIQQVACPIKFSGPEEAADYRRAPTLGQHTDEVLKRLGYSQSEIEQLHSAGDVYTENPNNNAG